MSIKITTRKTSLKNAKAPYTFTSSNESMSKEDFIKAMSENGSSFGIADAAGAYELIMQTTRDLLIKGYRVPLPFVDVYIQAKGSAQTQDESFTPNYTQARDHHFELNSSAHLYKGDNFLTNIKSQRVNSNDKYFFNPRIDDVKIINDKTMIIRGVYLGFDKSDDESGIFLVTQDQKLKLEVVEHTSSMIIVNLNKEIKDDSYILTLFTHRKDGKKQYTAKYNREISVKDSTISIKSLS